jgi:predicted CXXCH cytochrome family protein
LRAGPSYVLLVMLVAAAGGLSAFVACSPDTRERWKHFFFEVPPAEEEAADTRPPSQMAVEPLPAVAATHAFVSVHEPFARQRCGDCHDAERAQTLIQPWIHRCASCHNDLFVPRPFIHGPFAVGACNECHLPHASALPHLLRQADPAICLTCHEPTFKRVEEHHRAGGVGCTACHDPHHGADERMLRPDVDWRAFILDATPATPPEPPHSWGGP